MNAIRTDQDFMRLAIEQTRAGIAAGQTPFGAVIVRGGEVIVAAHNCVWATTDPTAHAEVTAIRAAAGELRTIDLSGCIMYTTTEPCPMCLAAIHWAKIERVLYGATIADAAAAGFHELRVPATMMVEVGGSPLKVELGPLRDECRELFDLWKKAGLSGAY